MPQPSESSDDNFKELMLKSVSSALDAVLGHSLKVVALSSLKRQFNLQTEDFVTRPEEFRTALRSLFGNEGTRHIEDRIVQWFYTSIGLEYRPIRTSLSKKVSKARKDYDAVSRALRKPSRRHKLRERPKTSMPSARSITLEKKNKKGEEM